MGVRSSAIRASRLPDTRMDGFSIPPPGQADGWLSARRRPSSESMIEAFLKCMQSEAKADTELPAAQEGVPPAADEGGAPLLPALSLACFGCARLPSDMGDDRVKHPMCQVCSKRKLPTMYWCCLDCPGNPGAWRCHAVEGIGLGLPSESALSPRDAPTLATFEEGEGPVPWVPWVSAQAQLPDLQESKTLLSLPQATSQAQWTEQCSAASSEHCS